MINLKSTKDGGISFSFEKTNVLDDNHGNELAVNLEGYFEDHKSITIDLDGIEEISSKGYSRLSDANEAAINCKCKINFVNAHENLSEIVDSFNNTSEG